MSEPTPIDALADAAAAFWPLVRFYPTLGGGWAAAINGGPALRAPTLSEVVAMAAACKPIPSIPRRPERRDLRVVKEDSGSRRWHVRWGGTVIFGAKTRREADDAVEAMTTRQENEISEWDEKWGAMVASGTEGVDFKWKV